MPYDTKIEDHLQVGDRITVECPYIESHILYDVDDRWSTSKKKITLHRYVFRDRDYNNFIYTGTELFITPGCTLKSLRGTVKRFEGGYIRLSRVKIER